MIYVEFYNQQNLMDFDKFTLENAHFCYFIVQSRIYSAFIFD